MPVITMPSTYNVDMQANIFQLIMNKNVYVLQFRYYTLPVGTTHISQVLALQVHVARFSLLLYVPAYCDMRQSKKSKVMCFKRTMA